MTVRVLTSGKVFEKNRSRPSQFAHTEFRRIIRTSNPGLKVLEVIADRGRTYRRFLSGTVVRIAAVGFLVAQCFGSKYREQFILFGFGTILECMAKPVRRFPVEDGQRISEFQVGLGGIYTQQQVDEAIYLGLARIRNHAFGKCQQSFILVASENFWRPRSVRHLVRGTSQKLAIGQMFVDGVGHGGVRKKHSRARATYQSANHLPARQPETHC